MNEPTRRALTTTLVTGPVRSGKSRHAEDLLSGHAAVIYLATGPRARAAGDIAAHDPAADVDPEWSARLAEHQQRRPEGWSTVETVDVVPVLLAATQPVLLDCLGTWLTGVVDEVGWDDLDGARSNLRSRADDLVEGLCAARVPVVTVTNEVGWSLVPTNAVGRFFQDELGRLNAAVSRVAARVHLVVAGRVVDLTDLPVVPGQPRARTLDA